MKIDQSNVTMAAASQKTQAALISRTKGSIVTTLSALEKLGLQPGQGGVVDGGVVLSLTEGAKDNAKNGKGKNAANDAVQKMADEAVEKAKNNDGLNKMARDSIRGNRAGRLDGLGNLFTNGYSDYRLELLNRFMELLMGKKFTINDLAKTMSSGANHTPRLAGAETTARASGDTPAVLNFNNVTIEYYEKESVSFSATASVTTEDGRKIEVEMALNMSRELYQKLDITTATAGTFCDPLVVNFDAAYAQLADKKITFDLDCDGTPDQISSLANGSGFLAVDDGSGNVNDGSQLFGAKSGNGFKDLAEHDSDGNGWIDENDDIWNSLRIWTQDGDGGSRLFALGEVGIGAIYLGNVATNYNLHDSSGQTEGALRYTGFFLREDGTAGTVQHVDLKI